jgi:hypothetical protein
MIVLVSIHASLISIISLATAFGALLHWSSCSHSFVNEAGDEWPVYRPFLKVVRPIICFNAAML